MIRYELKKILFNVSIVFFLVVCTFLEIYKIGEYSQLNSPLDRVFGGSAYSDTFEKYGGKITLEKAQYVIDFTLSAQQLIQSGDYDETADTKDYITESLYSDYILFSVGFYSPMKYSYDYREYADKISQKALENVDFFTSIGNDYEAEKNREIYRLYSGRGLSEIYKTEGYNNFLKYEFTCIPICFMLIIGLAGVFVREKTVGMRNLLCTCSKGGGRVFLSKIVAGYIYALSVFIWFTALDLICFSIIYGFDGGEAPIYAIEIFKNIPLNCSVLGFVIFTLLLRFVGFLTLSSIIMAISACVSQTSVCGVVSSAVTALLLFADNLGVNFIAQISPIRLIVSTKMFEKYNAVNIFGIPVPLYSVLVVGNILACAALSALCGIVWTRIGKSRFKFGKTVEKCSTNSESAS